MEIAFVMNQYFLIAQLLNLLSYSQTNFLFLRILFLGAALFYIIYGLTQEIIMVDYVFFNFLFFILNLRGAILLYRQLIPPSLSKELEDIYYQFYSKYMNKSDFRLLFSIASKQTYKISSILVKPGNGFSSMFYIPNIPNTYSIYVKQEGSYKQSPNTWVGILEFSNLISNTKKITNKELQYNKYFWMLKLNIVKEVKIEKKNTCDSLLNLNYDGNLSFDINLNENLIDKSNEDTVLMYEFDLIKLFDIFNNHERGEIIKKTLYSLWLERCSEYVKGRNEVNFNRAQEDKRFLRSVSKEYNINESQFLTNNLERETKV